LDFCHAFWDWLLRENATNTVLSIEKVGDELEAGEDDLAAWAEARGPEFFLKPTAAMAKSLVVVSEWAQNQEYEAVAVSRFLEGADYYLVALLFVIFDLEAVFLYAWAVSARPGGWAALGSVAVFVGVLLAGLGYLWGVGALDWGTGTTSDE